MKFPRHSRLLRGPFDMAPFAAVLFLLVIFMMLGALVPTPGLPLRLPVANDLPGTGQQRALHAAANHSECAGHAELYRSGTPDRRLCGLHFPICLSDGAVDLDARDWSTFCRIDCDFSRPLSGHAGNAKCGDDCDACAADR